MKMGSMGSDVKVEYQHIASHCKKYKLPRKHLLVGCGAFKDAPVPRKLRSVLKKRARESTTSHLSIPKKQLHVSNKVVALKKDSVKKSKPERRHITKDEKEVAETLYTLAAMFSHPNKSKPPISNYEPTDMKSSDALETGSSVNAVEGLSDYFDSAIPTRIEESRKIISKVTVEADCHSPNFSDSQAQFVKFQSPYVAQKPEWPCNKLASSFTDGFRVESVLRLLHGPRVSTEHTTDLKQVTSFGAQYGKKNHPMNDKLGVIRSPTGTQSFETQTPCLRLDARFESTNFVTQPRDSTGKCSRAAVESKKSWRRSSGHVYISRLIKVLQVSDKTQGSTEKPARLMTCGGAHQVNGTKICASFDGVVSYASEKVSTEIQDRQLVIGTSSTLRSPKEGYDFLSLGTEVYGLDANGGINRAGHGHDCRKQFNAQNYANMLFSMPRNGYSSTFHGHTSALTSQQAQLPRYLSNTASGSFRARFGRHQLRDQYSNEGFGSPHLPEWKNGCAEALFPHLLGSMYHHHEFNSGIERNGAAFYSENMKQFQLPCNRHL